MRAVVLALLALVAGGDGGARPADLPADPDAPTVSARVDREEARVGDPIQLSIVGIRKKGMALNLPAALELGKFQVLDRKDSDVDLGDGRARREFQLTVAAYETGDLAVPPIEVPYLTANGEVRSVATPRLDVTITALTANEPDPQLKDIAAPVTVLEEVRWPLYLMGGALGASALFLAWTWARRRLRARRAVAVVAPTKAAHEVALERLDDLRRRTPFGPMDLKPFYLELSEIIRAYLGARYGFDSLELTTTELMGELRARAPQGVAHGDVEGWLSACDLVKFARYPATEGEARDVLEQAYRIVEQTRPRVEPAVALDAPRGQAA